MIFKIVEVGTIQDKTKMVDFDTKSRFYKRDCSTEASCFCLKPAFRQKLRRYGQRVQLISEFSMWKIG